VTQREGGPLPYAQVGIFVGATSGRPWFACAIMLASLLLGMPLSAHADITTGLVGHWKFDEGTGTTVADSSGGREYGDAGEWADVRGGEKWEGVEF